ncbi:hypothetical protein D3C86_1163470 [compost metagenome]
MQIDEQAELVAAKACDHILVTANRALDVRGKHFEQFVSGIVAKAVVDPLEMVDVQEHDRQHPAFVGFLDEFFGEDLVEPAAVDQVGQRVVVRHLLQRHARLVQLAEQGVDPLQVVVLVLQFLVRQCRADAAPDDQQGDDCHGQRQLQVAVFAGLRWQAVAGQHQIEGGHGREVHAQDACPKQQAGAVFEELMQHPGAVAQIPCQQQGCQRGTDRDRDGKGKQARMVVDRSAGVHGRHAHVMHGRDTQADPDRCLEALSKTQLGKA